MISQLIINIPFALGLRLKRRIGFPSICMYVLYKKVRLHEWFFSEFKYYLTVDPKSMAVGLKTD